MMIKNTLILLTILTFSIALLACTSDEGPSPEVQLLEIQHERALLDREKEFNRQLDDVNRQLAMVKEQLRMTEERTSSLLDRARDEHKRDLEAKDEYTKTLQDRLLRIAGEMRQVCSAGGPAAHEARPVDGNGFGTPFCRLDYSKQRLLRP